MVQDGKQHSFEIRVTGLNVSADGRATFASRSHASRKDNRKWPDKPGKDPIDIELNFTKGSVPISSTAGD
jgi:hypothetical protein